MTRDEGDIRLGENSLVVGCARGNERIIKYNWAKIGMMLLLLYVIDLTYLSQVSNKHFQTNYYVLVLILRYSSLTIMTA